jgi:hypothetical protein
VHRPGEPREPTVVCVIGAPRSGTSLTARILNLAGVYLGPERDLRPAGVWNQEGFWENRRIVAINKRLRDQTGRGGIEPPTLPPGWATSEALASERAEARALLRETFAGHRLWGWKDPGTTLVLPFWQQLVPRMRYVICLRNPLDIAMSASAIKALTTAKVVAAWPRYVAAALAHTAGQPRILVSYDDYLHARRGTVERLWRFVGNDGLLDGNEAERLEAPIDDSLLRHRTSIGETVHEEDLPPEAAAMYLSVELLRQVTSEADAGGATTTIEEAVDAHARRVLNRDEG